MAVMRASWRFGLVAGSVLGVASLVAACLVVPASAAGAATVAQTFTETGSLQQFTVPAGICGVSITATGGSGGSDGAIGGRGAAIRAHLTVSPSEQLQIVVGGAGGAGTGSPPGFGGAGGYGGGGGGGWFGAGAGGGASAILDPIGPLVVAGAGGGSNTAFGQIGAGGDAGLLGSDGAAGGVMVVGSVILGGGGGGTSGGVGGIGGSFTNLGASSSAGSGGGVAQGGANPDGNVGGDGSNGFGGGGGGAGVTGDPHPGQAASPTGTGAGGAAGTGGIAGGPGGQGTAGGGDGAAAGVIMFDGGGGGGGGGGFGGGGGGVTGGGGGSGYGAGGGGGGGGGGGSSWVTPDATSARSALASKPGDGTVTISYDSVGDLCTVVLPGSGIVPAPSTGTADLAVSVTLNTPSALPVTAQWHTLFVPGLGANPYLGPQAPTTDYTASSGTVTFAPGDTSTTVHIPVLADSSPGPDEFVLVSFSAPTNARMGGFYGLGFGIITPAP
jgi:hypothetical protein